jgi:hypothetical protein
MWVRVQTVLCGCEQSRFFLTVASLLPAAEVKELEEKGELEDGDPLNGFFKKIFAQVLHKHLRRPKHAHGMKGKARTKSIAELL